MFPDSQHVDGAGLRGQPDTAVWQHARQYGFAIVSKDDDFRQLSFLHGAPPKVIWLSVGNAGTNAILTCLLSVEPRSRLFPSISRSLFSFFACRERLAIFGVSDQVSQLEANCC
ncbi:MAG: DUF5615 family PIN-like protein [Burkholderiales bacterium]